MTLLINSNKDFDWVWVNSKLLVYLFSQCKVSLCERNKRDVSSLLVNVGENCCSISAQKTKGQVLFTICSQSENTDSGAALCKWTTRTPQTCLSKTFANSPNEQKQQETIKNRFWLWLSIIWQTRKLTRYRSKQFSYRTFLYSDVSCLQTFLLIFKFASHWTIAYIVSTANKPLVGTLMTIGDVTRNIAIEQNTKVYPYN